MWPISALTLAMVSSESKAELRRAQSHSVPTACSMASRFSSVAGRKLFLSKLAKAVSSPAWAPAPCVLTSDSAMTSASRTFGALALAQAECVHELLELGQVLELFGD